MPKEGAIDYIELPASDIPATKAFYGGVFGWTFTDYGPDYVAFAFDGRDGGFNAERKVIANGGPLLVLYANDLDAMEKRWPAPVRKSFRGRRSPAAAVSISAIPTATRSPSGQKAEPLRPVGGA